MLYLRTVRTLKTAQFAQIRQLSYKKLRTWYSGLVKPKPQEAPFNHIIQIGDPTLRTVADAIPHDLIASPEIQFLLTRMQGVFNQYKCIGLAAPQIGITLRVIMFEFNKKHASYHTSEQQKVKEMSIMPFTAVINPEIKVTDYTKLTFTESCESVKGFYADVPRYRGLVVKGFGANGESVEVAATGWTARIIQHEMDHLNGKVYTDIMDRKSLACTCWQVVNERGGKVELPYGTN